MINASKKRGAKGKPQSATEADSHDESPSQTSLFELIASRNFVKWLAEQSVSLALSTCQAGMLLFLSAGRYRCSTVISNG